MSKFVVNNGFHIANPINFCVCRVMLLCTRKNTLYTLQYYLSCSSSLSIIMLYKHYNANDIHQRQGIDLCCINIISNKLNLAIMYLHV